MTCYRRANSEPRLFTPSEISFDRNVPHSEKGSFATVYKGNLNGKFVALKKLRRGWGDPQNDVSERMVHIVPLT